MTDKPWTFARYGNGKSAPSLLIRKSIGDGPGYVAARFTNEDACAQAVRALNEYPLLIAQVRDLKQRLAAIATASE